MHYTLARCASSPFPSKRPPIRNYTKFGLRCNPDLPRDTNFGPSIEDEIDPAAIPVEGQVVIEVVDKMANQASRSLETYLETLDTLVREIKSRTISEDQRKRFTRQLRDLLAIWQRGTCCTVPSPLLLAQGPRSTSLGPSLPISMRRLPRDVKLTNFKSSCPNISR